MEDNINKKVSFLGKKLIQISETEKKECKFYSINILGDKKETVNHHILLVDVSGSMYNEITELKKRLIDTLEALKKGGNNYVSIIIYSGHNESYRIVNAVKCDKISYNMAQVYKIIDTEIYCRGVTVISEPLESSVEIVKNLVDVCDKHEIILFTDGCLVPMKWNTKTEKEKCFAVAEICKKQGIFLNAIGFGAYYDREFLKELVQLVGNGVLTHIDEIIDYYKTIVNMAEEIMSKEIIKVKIDSSDYFVLGQRERLKGEILINSLKRNIDNIIVTFDDDLKIDGTVIKSTNKKVNDDLVEDFYYALAFYHVVNEDSDSAEVALAQTKDINAYMELNNSHSFLEKGNSIKRLNTLIQHKDKRYKKGKAEIKIVLPEDEPMCLLELLKEILEDSESELLWDYSYKYKRIGNKKKTIEDNYRFIRQNYGFGPITDVSIGSKKLNIGVKVKVNGQVENIENKLKLDAYTYREYNLVVNGNINTPFIWCKLSKDLKRKLRKEKLIKSTTKYNNEFIYTLDLRKVKSTNKRLYRLLNQKEIAQYLNDLEVLRCKQWALNKCIDGILSSNKLNKIDFSETLSEEEKSIRKEFRVDSYGLYTPLSVEQEENLSYEVYVADVLEWKVEKFPKKKQQELAMEEATKLINDDINNSYINLIEALTIVKNDKNRKENIINLVRLSSALLNKEIFIWDKEIEKEKVQFDKVLNTNVVIGEKVTINNKNIEGIIIRQDKYKLLTRCN